MIDTVDLEVVGREETLNIDLLPLYKEIEDSPKQFQLEACEQSPMHG